MVERRKEGLRANLGLKALSVVLATGVWMYVNSRGHVTVNFAVPITPTGLPAHLVLTETGEPTADVRLTGREAALARVDTSQVRVPLDLSAAQPGAQWITLRTDDVKVPAPVSVERINPRQVRVTVERREERAVQVVADLTGNPAPGMEVAAIAVEPREVIVTGGESAFDGLERLRTQPIDLTGLDRNLRREARLDMGGRELAVTSREPIYVTITVKKSAPVAGKSAP
ncbi:MAG: hypothetical protein HZA24_09925 [Nitrospirae bacterium]|nr:hypothetical protein [Nitrospirota bacterium]